MHSTSETHLLAIHLLVGTIIIRIVMFLIQIYWWKQNLNGRGKINTPRTFLKSVLLWNRDMMCG